MYSSPMKLVHVHSVTYFLLLSEWHLCPASFLFSTWIKVVLFPHSNLSLKLFLGESRTWRLPGTQNSQTPPGAGPGPGTKVVWLQLQVTKAICRLFLALSLYSTLILILRILKVNNLNESNKYVWTDSVTKPKFVCLTLWKAKTQNVRVWSRGNVYWLQSNQPRRWKT